MRLGVGEGDGELSVVNCDRVGATSIVPCQLGVLSQLSRCFPSGEKPLRVFPRQPAEFLDELRIGLYYVSTRVSWASHPGRVAECQVLLCLGKERWCILGFH